MRPRTHTRTRSTLLASIVVALGLGLTACGGGGVSQQDVDAIRGQLEVIEQRLDDVDSMLANALNGSPADTEVLVDEAHQELVDTRAMLSNVLAELAPPPADPAAPADPMTPMPTDPGTPAPGGTPDAPAF